MDLRQIMFTLASSSGGWRYRLDGLQKSTKVVGPGFNLIGCSPEVLRVGEHHFMKSGLERLRVARELPWSVARSSSAVELVAVLVLLVLI